MERWRLHQGGDPCEHRADTVPSPASPTLALTPELVDALWALVAQQTVIEPVAEEQKQITGPGANEGEQEQASASCSPSLGEPVEPIRGGTKQPSYGDQIEALLKRQPQLTVRQIAERVGCSKNTADKWVQRLKVPGEREEGRGSL